MQEPEALPESMVMQATCITLVAHVQLRYFSLGSLHDDCSHCFFHHTARCTLSSHAEQTCRQTSSATCGDMRQSGHHTHPAQGHPILPGVDPVASMACSPAAVHFRNHLMPVFYIRDCLTCDSRNRTWQSYMLQASRETQVLLRAKTLLTFFAI